MLEPLHRALTSKHRSTFLTKLVKLKPRYCHSVAHRAAHRWEPCEICGIVKILRSYDVSDDQVVGEARDGSLRGGFARIGRAVTFVSA